MQRLHRGCAAAAFFFAISVGFASATICPSFSPVNTTRISLRRTSFTSFGVKPVADRT